MDSSVTDLEVESDYNIYAKQLASLGYGIPLWQPSPLSDYKRVNIADVGYIRTGQFYRLFNASLPSDDPAQCRGVPANFLPLHLDEVSSERKQIRMPGVLHTRDLRFGGVDFNLLADPAWIENGQTVRFESSTGQGAILVTKNVTLREDAVQLGFLESYMAENYESWLEMANSTMGRGIRLEDLILVTGYDLTTQSAMAAFNGGGPDFSITFKAAFPSGKSSSLSAWGEWHTASSATVFKNFGSTNLFAEVHFPPDQQSLLGLSTTDLSEFNQCVFLRGFRIRRRPETAFQITSSPTNHGLGNQDDKADSLGLSDHIYTAGPMLSESQYDKTITVESITDKQPFADPLEPRFDHIFEANLNLLSLSNEILTDRLNFQSTDVQKAIVHDNDFSIPLQAVSGNTPPQSVPTSAHDENVPLQSSSPKIAPMNEVSQITPPDPPRPLELAPLDTPEIPLLVLSPSPSTDPADWTFPLVPAGLKGITAYLQRAQELKVKNPVIAYWCTYYAVKQGIASTFQNENTRLFLGQVMSVLEGMKTSLGDNDAVLDDDVSAKYIAKFASRVFKKADSEDQKHKANRSTAKKFLASATFFELMGLFERPIEADTEEKINYAKWKAADIAKACKEGRTPLPGNMHAPSHFSSAGSMATPAASEALELPHETMSAWSPGPSLAPSPAPSPAVQYLRSLETSPAARADVPLHTVLDPVPSSPTDRSPSMSRLLSPVDAFDTDPGSGNIRVTESETDRLREFIWNLGEAPRGVEDEEQEDANELLTLAINPGSEQHNFTIVDDNSVIPEDTSSESAFSVQPEEPPPVAKVKRVHFSPSVVGGLSSTSSSVAASSPPASPERYAPSLPTVQEAAYSSDSDREGGHPNTPARPQQDPTLVPLPEPTASEYSVSDSEDSEGWAHGMPPIITKVPSPTSPPSPSGSSSAKILHNASSLQPGMASPQFFSQIFAGFSPHPSAPPALHPTPRFYPHALVYADDTTPSPPSPSDGSTSPELDGKQVTQAQRHCRFAISALDYEDAEAARNEIRAALAILYD